MDDVHATFDVGKAIASLIGLLLTLAFGAWAWVVKSFGQQHIDSVRELAVELRELRKDVNGLMARVQVVEFAQQHYHPNKD
jgi:hypothetical protein